MEKSSYPRRSSGLRFQFLSVEVFSFLPQRQSNGSNLARQRQPHHGGLDAPCQRALVKVLKRSGLYAGQDGRGFKQAFQIVVVVPIQTTNKHLLLAPPRLALDELIFPTVASL